MFLLSPSNSIFVDNKHLRGELTQSCQVPINNYICLVLLCLSIVVWMRRTLTGSEIRTLSPSWWCLGRLRAKPCPRGKSLVVVVSSQIQSPFSASCLPLWTWVLCFRLLPPSLFLAARAPHHDGLFSAYRTVFRQACLIQCSLLQRFWCLCGRCVSCQKFVLSLFVW